MQVLRDRAACRSFCDGARAAGRTLALVPTMGYLHAGHLSLIAAARAEGADCVVSIYVNPTQFGPTEDLAVYPRDPEGDRAKLAAAGVDALFEPATLYDADPPHETYVTVEALQLGLCGRSRPTHFRGVATVVCKLLNLTRPHLAVFGLKDYQQFAVLSRMVRDLDMGVRMVGAPLLRDVDGLALSSRNARLSAAARASALALPRALMGAAAAFGSCGGGEAAAATAAGLARGVADAVVAAGGEVDYVEVVERATLRPPAAGGGGGGGGGPEPGTLVLLAAAVFGGVRLLDNVEL